MPTRNAYTALTPDYADFATRHSPGAAVDLSRPASPTSAEEVWAEKDPSRWRAALSSAKGVVHNNAGLLLVAASQAFFSFMNVAVKKLNNIDTPVGTLELVAVRMGITYICSLTYMLSANVPDPFLGPKGVRLLLVFRGFSGFFGLFGIYYSLQYLSLSDATVLTFLAPMCTAFAGALFLKESFTRKEALASIFSLLGVVLIARPVFIFGNDAHAPDPGLLGIDEYAPADNSEKGTPAERLVAVGVALVGVLGATGAYTSLSAIGKRAHPLHSLTSFSIQCVIVSLIGMLAMHSPFIIPTRLDWVALLVMIGVFGFIAQVLLTMGLQRETAGRGSLAVYTQVVFATILERVFFKESSSILSVIGTLIIVTSAVYVALTKEQGSSNKPSVVRLATMHEAALEEGLLEYNREEDAVKSPMGELQHLKDEMSRSPSKSPLMPVYDMNAEEDTKEAAAAGRSDSS